jgi:hypothetical protein
MTDMATYSGAFSGEKEIWSTIKWNRTYRNVRRLQARIVKAKQTVKPRPEWGAFERLELIEGKPCAAERAAESLTESGEVRRRYLWAVRLT